MFFVFKGQEFLEIGTWTDNPKNNPDAMLDWNRVKKYTGIFRLYRDLIKLRRNREKTTRGLIGQHIRVFHADDQRKVIAYHRWMEGGPGDDVVVVANFSNESLNSYTIGFPSSGAWVLRFNSDQKDYSDDFTNQGDSATAVEGQYDGLQCRGNVVLGPYSLIILSQS